MTLQELTDYYDRHPEQPDEIMSDSWKYWNKELDEMVKELEK